jgi:hypothetical protein
MGISREKVVEACVIILEGYGKVLLQDWKADERVPFFSIIRPFIDLFASSQGDPSPPFPESPERNFDLWYRSITEYSERGLAIPNDKLPTISGYAHETFKFIGGPYLAGLWAQDLIVGLLWCVNRSWTTVHDQNKRLSIPFGRGAPSWSWVSFDCGIRYFSTIRHTGSLRDPSLQCASILEAHVTPSTLDPMGQVSSGLLKVESYLKEVRWLRQPKGLPRWMPGDLNPNNPSRQDYPRLLDHLDVGSWDVLLDVAEDGAIPSSPLIPTRPDGRPIAICIFDV